MKPALCTAFLLLLLPLGGCSSSDDDEKSAGGRTRSLAMVGSQATTQPRLRLRRERDEADLSERMTLRVESPRPAPETGVLVLPNGQELEWSTANVDSAGWRVFQVTTLEAGSYSLLWRAGGSTHSGSLVLEGAPPEYPRLLSPLPQERLDPGSEAIQWDAPLSGSFDLSLLPAASVEPTLRRAVTSPYTLGVSLPVGSATLSVIAVSADDEAAAVGWESATLAQVVLGAAP